jgi:hypothetical protein
MAPRNVRDVPGDIVWCYFPSDLGVVPADKPRPGLILEVYSDRAPEFDVLVAYGTSQKASRLYSGEFAITGQDGAAFRLAGLSYPTKFNLKRRIELPFNELYFQVPPLPRRDKAQSWVPCIQV